MFPSYAFPPILSHHVATKTLTFDFFLLTVLVFPNLHFFYILAAILQRKTAKRNFKTPIFFFFKSVIDHDSSVCFNRGSGSWDFIPCIGIATIRAAIGTYQMHRRRYQKQFNDGRKISRCQTQRGSSFAGFSQALRQGILGMKKPNFYMLIFFLEVLLFYF